MRKTLSLLCISTVLITSVSAAQNNGEVSASTATTHRDIQIDNDLAKVWKSVIAPHQPLKMHRHDGLRIITGLKGGTLKIFYEDGSTSDLVIETGQSQWRDPDPPDTLHGDRNDSEMPIEVMVVEIKKLQHPSK